jgi:hypothetical protein
MAVPTVPQPMMAMVGFIFTPKSKTLARHPAMGNHDRLSIKKGESEPARLLLLPVHLATYDLGKYGVRSSTYSVITLNPASRKAEMAFSPWEAPTLMIR